MITFVSWNTYKQNIAKEIFTNEYSITLEFKSLETPEIQSLNVAKVAEFSAKRSAKELWTSVLVTDVSYQLHALNNFPWTMVKRANKRFSSDEILQLMQWKKDRSASIIWALTYANQEWDYKTFISKRPYSITEYIYSKSQNPFDQIMVPEGYSKPQSELSIKEKTQYFIQTSSNYHQMAQRLLESKIPLCNQQ
jgi:non-canonical purine NTP pyrophosphatase (RdgB/HAM1 family)